MTGLPTYPPHGPGDLRTVTDAIVTALRSTTEEQRSKLPYHVLRAWGRLEQMEHENDEWRVAVRAEALTRPSHYISKPLDKLTLCGLRSDQAPHGWVGNGNEFLNRRIERGGAICPDCLKGAVAIEESKP